MADNPHLTLEQWRALIAVVEAGGYAQAAESLHKSQSSVTYAVQKIERLLGLKVFQIHGRKAALTEAGQVLYRRARTLLEEALFLERGAAGMAAGGKTEINIAAEIIFPTWLLLQCMATFAQERPHTRLELYETVLGGTDEMIVDGRADLAICSQIPAGFLGGHLMRLRFIAAAAPEHPLHHLDRELTHRDLRKQRQLVIRDSGTRRSRSGAWLGSEQRWTVSHKATSIRAATMGLGFAWYPEENIRSELAAGTLKPLRLKEGGERYAELYLVYGKRDYVDPDTARLAEIIRAAVKRECTDAAHAARTPARG